MAPWQAFCQATAAVFLLAMIQTNAQTTRVYQAFIINTAPVPLSLDASIVAVTPNQGIYSTQTVLTMSVDCPKPASPENNACRAQSLYPIELWHTQGSMFGGTATLRVDDSTTAWTCDLGSGSDGGPSCIMSITAAGGATRVETTKLSECDVEAHSVPVVVTAGAEKLEEHWYFTVGLSALVSYRASELLSMGCPSSLATPGPAISTTTAVSSGVTSTTSTSGTGTPSAAARVTTTPSQPLQTAATSPSPSSSTTSTSGSSSFQREMQWLMAVLPVVLCLYVQ